jgi:hypothetical protein
MDFEGWILDARPEVGGLSLLLTDGHRRARAWVRAAHDLYLRLPDPGTLDRLLEHPEAVRAQEESWYAPPWYRTLVPIHRLSFRSVEGARAVEATVRVRGLGEVYNTFPGPVTRALYALGCPATSRVRAEGSGVFPEGETPGESAYLGRSGLTLLEDPLALGYAPPGFRLAEVRFFDWYGETTAAPSHHPPERFRLSFWDGATVTTEEGPLPSLGSHAAALSAADVLMYPRAFRWLLGRAGVDITRVPITLHRHSPGSAPLPEEIVKLVEWSRISFLPMGELAGASIGKALTANEVRRAFERRYLVPDRPVHVERRKSLQDLVTHDRGGVLFRPVPGIYGNVAQLDFSSMYPALIARWNISPETVNAPGAVPVLVPGVRHTVEPAAVRRGIVPEALEWLIARREATRARGAADPTADLRQGAIKWLLVASFGYLGFRNARFGKIEAHECVTALSRHYMRQAIRVATDRGFRVLHVMVDSLFAQKEGATGEEFQALLEAIRTETGLGIKVDAHYDWVVLCNNRGTEIGSPARYFGRLLDGSLKVKGLDVVRRDTPGVVRKVQAAALQELGAARTPHEFGERLPQVATLFEEAAANVRRNAVDPADWVLTVARGKRAGGSDGGSGPGGYGDVPFVQIIEGRRPYMADLGFSGVAREHYVRRLEKAKEQLTPTNLARPGSAGEVVGW